MNKIQLVVVFLLLVRGSLGGRILVSTQFLDDVRTEAQKFFESISPLGEYESEKSNHLKGSFRVSNRATLTSTPSQQITQIDAIR